MIVCISRDGYILRCEAEFSQPRSGGRWFKILREPAGKAVLVVRTNLRDGITIDLSQIKVSSEYSRGVRAIGMQLYEEVRDTYLKARDQVR